MVAAHAYDLRAAKKVYVPCTRELLQQSYIRALVSGMKTVYVHRWTEDPDLDMSILRTEFDAFVDGRNTTSTAGGLISVAGLLGA